MNLMIFIYLININPINNVIYLYNARALALAQLKYHQVKSFLVYDAEKCFILFLKQYAASLSSAIYHISECT